MPLVRLRCEINDLTLSLLPASCRREESVLLAGDLNALRLGQRVEYYRTAFIPR